MNVPRDIRATWIKARLRGWNRSDTIALVALLLSLIATVDSRLGNKRTSRLEAEQLIAEANIKLDATLPPPQPLGERIRLEAPGNRTLRKEAEQQIRRAITMEPRLATAHRALGRLMWQNGRYTDAVSELRLAVKIEPRDADSQALLGHTYLSASQWSDGAKAYRRAIEIDAANLDALNGLGEIARRTLRYGEAREWFENAVSADPNDALSKYNLGKTLVLMDELSLAEKAFREATVLDPSRMPSRSTLESWIDLATLRNNEGDLLGAERALRRALDVAPADPVATHNLALVLVESGKSLDGEAALSKFDEAEGLFRKGVAINPNSVQMHRNFALFLIERNRPDEAESALRTVMRLAPDDDRTRQMLATVRTMKQRAEINSERSSEETR